MKPGPLQSQWLAELRSGKYAQVPNVLRNKDGYCCLGIATEITCGVNPDGFDDTEVCFVYDADRKFVLPLDVKEKLKFYTSAGHSISGELKALSELNDRGVPFADIADHVEKHFDQYFTESV